LPLDLGVSRNLAANWLTLRRIAPKEVLMRWIYLAIIILFFSATIIFAVQNLQVVTIGFLGLSLRAPLALLIVGIYVVGAVTGGSLFALLRKSVERARPKRAPA
jgi:putative membrane protein